MTEYSRRGTAGGTTSGGLAGIPCGRCATKIPTPTSAATTTAPAISAPRGFCRCGAGGFSHFEGQAAAADGLLASVADGLLAGVGDGLLTGVGVVVGRSDPARRSPIS